MGAGLSESIGTLSLIIFGYCLYNYLNNSGFKTIVILSLSIAFCFISSPGGALTAILFFIISISYFLVKSLILNEKKILFLLSNAIIISLLSTILTLPYWYNVVSNHGFAIFFESVIHQFNSSNQDFLFLVNYQIRSLLNFNFIYVDYSGIWNAFIVVSLFYLFSKKYFFIPITFLCINLIPRESIWITPILGSIIFGLFFSLQNCFENKRIMFPLLISVLFLNSIFYMVDFIAINQKSGENLSLEEISIMKEIKLKIPQNSKVIILGNEGFTEWFPFLVERTVMNVEYGTEFDSEKQEQISSYNNSIKDCLNMKCVRDLSNKTFGDDLYYFIVDKHRINNKFDIKELNVSQNVIVIN